METTDQRQAEAAALLASAHAVQAARLTLPVSSPVGSRLASLSADLAKAGRARARTSLRSVKVPV